MKGRIWFLVLAAAVMALSLAACGGKETSERSPAIQAGADSSQAAEAGQERSGAASEPTGNTRGSEGYRLHFTRPFPDVKLFDLEGEPVSTRSLLKSRDTIVLFLSTSCEVCAATIETWKQFRDQIPEGSNIFGVVAEEPDFAKKWAAVEAPPFPLYCDPDDLFSTRYHVEGRPVVVGVNAEGTILYALPGVTDFFLPSQAIKLLEQGKKELAKRRAKETTHE